MFDFLADVAVFVYIILYVDVVLSRLECGQYFREFFFAVDEDFYFVVDGERGKDIFEQEVNDIVVLLKEGLIQMEGFKGGIGNGLLDLLIAVFVGNEFSVVDFIDAPVFAYEQVDDDADAG